MVLDEVVVLVTAVEGLVDLMAVLNVLFATNWDIFVTLVMLYMVVLLKFIQPRLPAPLVLVIFHHCSHNYNPLPSRFPKKIILLSFNFELHSLLHNQSLAHLILVHSLSCPRLFTLVLFLRHLLVLG